LTSEDLFKPRDMLKPRDLTGAVSSIEGQVASLRESALNKG